MADEKEAPKKSEEAKPAGEGEAAAPAKKGGKKIVIIAVALILLLVAIGAPVLFLMGKKEENNAIEELSASAAKIDGSELIPEGGADQDEAQEGEEALGAIFPLETFVVNLSGGSFIRLQLQLEFTERDIPQRFYSKLVPIRDAIITLLSARTSNDVSSVKGKEVLKAELKELVNDQLKREDVKQIYFTQFIVQ